VAAAGVDGEGVSSAEAELQRPVGFGWPGLDAALVFLLAPFGVCDLLPDPVEAEL
jgi:hypothetical protein